MCHSKWISSCLRFHEFIGDKFEKWALLVDRRPKLISAICTILTLVLCSGFIFFDIYGQTERIFFPQDSIPFKNLDRAEKYFTYYIQYEEFIFLSSEPLLSTNIFKEALHIHEGIRNIPGLEQFCVKDSSTSSCLTTSPLELFGFSADNMVDVEGTILKYLKNESHIMSNGYNAKINMPNYLGNLKYSIQNNSISTNALRITYPVKFGKQRYEYERNKKWELKMIKYLLSKRGYLAQKNITLLYNTVRSDDDSVEENTEDNLFLIVASISAMVLFCAVSTSSIRNCVKGHLLVSLMGILCVTLGIGCGFGLTLYLRIPYVGFVGVLPFLVLGIGIDDMFIILNHLDMLPADITGSKRLGRALRHSGLTITMTTATDLVAFLIGTVSQFPAIRIFCIYAAFSLLFAYLMMISLFLVFLSLDIKRIEQNRDDCIPRLSQTMDDDKMIWEKEETTSLSKKIIKNYAEILMKLPVKIIVILLASVFIGVCIYGTIKTNLHFDYKIVGSDDSDYIKWYSTMEKHFPPFHRLYIDIILDEPKIDYTHEKTQQQFYAIDQITKVNSYLNETNTMNWMTSFLKWRESMMLRNSSTNDFYKDLHVFLAQYPVFNQSIVFDETINKILASRVHVQSVTAPDWLYRKDIMLSLREDVKKKLDLPFYPVSFMYIYATHLVIIIHATIVNMSICCAAILLLTLPYVIYPTVSFILFLNFITFVIELLGIMYFWDLSLNSITMIVMVMAIGFTVDYSCHTTHAYLVADKNLTPEKRVVESLTSVGLSVLKGGLSTLVGIIVLVFSTSKLFRLFFKMMFTIIFVGLVHGLAILPVLLTVFCRGKLPSNTKAVKLTEINGNHRKDDAEGMLIRQTDAL